MKHAPRKRGNIVADVLGVFDDGVKFLERANFRALSLHAHRQQIFCEQRRR